VTPDNPDSIITKQDLLKTIIILSSKTEESMDTSHQSNPSHFPIIPDRKKTAQIYSMMLKPHQSEISQIEFERMIYCLSLITCKRMYHEFLPKNSNEDLSIIPQEFLSRLSSQVLQKPFTPFFLSDSQRNLNTITFDHFYAWKIRNAPNLFRPLDIIFSEKFISSVVAPSPGILNKSSESSLHHNSSLPLSYFSPFGPYFSAKPEFIEVRHLWLISLFLPDNQLKSSQSGQSANLLYRGSEHGFSM